MPEIRLGKFCALCSLNSDDDEMVLTSLPWDEEDCVTYRPNLSKKPRPIRDFSPSATTKNVAKFEVQPLGVIGACTFPSMRIGAFESVLSGRLTFSWI